MNIITINRITKSVPLSHKQITKTFLKHFPIIHYISYNRTGVLSALVELSPHTLKCFMEPW